MSIFTDDRELTKKLRDFIKGRTTLPRSAWVNSDIMKVYLRDGNRMLNDGVVEECITVANVTVFEPNRGIYKEFLAFIQSESKRTILIENVHMADHFNMYAHMGFTRIEPYDGFVANFFRPYTKKLTALQAAWLARP